ncbi:phosphoenolpyruvate--protein phosphotransferase [Oceanisphaera arctica]|uniref:phosphoenolpyruvate--protein phosphotransferase n=1 Tax=Oceanisphaera arctica TaxID=641510 RepID=A0A2P5TR21_9GAMM|nr:phosphoenolpyruvate--protein phosphotransferase [Oceanisphaera arctica]PPL18232.1 phosphoenolpyruvate--protein phosphotransferase [Oceanisphaera arctica]GHA12595.1 PTS fructose transporter subunit FruI [Oceanisphaera arctica]
MFSLTAQDVKTGVPLADKAAVIQALADWLEQDGHVAAGYGAGMLTREAQNSTYLGQGIAIPHGTQECRHLIKNTGIKAMHLPDGVPWGGGERAYLVLGIAAGSDEHLDLLKQLARTLSRDGLFERVKAARQSQEVLQLLQGNAESATETKFVLSADRVAVKARAGTLELLVEQAATLMQLNPTEESALQQSAGMYIGQGWWLKQIPADDKPGAALLTASGITHRQQPVSGLLALAVRGSEHKTLLTRVADWLAAGRGAELAGQDSAEALLNVLKRGPVSLSSHQRTVVVRNTHGLHARPGAMLVQAAKNFDADIQVCNLDGDEHWVSAKSLMKMIGLGVKAGHQLVFRAEGPDAEAALDALTEAVNGGLGEAFVAQATEPQAEEHDIHEPQGIDPNTLVRGVAASPGIAIGPVFVDAPLRFDYPQQAGDTQAEQQKLSAAIEQASAELSATLRRLSDTQARDMMSMHRELLADSSLTQGVSCRIKQGQSAAAAWWSEIDSAADRQAASSDALLAERAADIRDIGRRVMAILCHSRMTPPPEHPYLWLAQDIGPSQLVNLDPSRVLGLVTVGGGASSHSAILARSLGIPALVAAGGAVMALPSGTEAILNGDDGTLWVAPEAAMLEQARVRQQREREQAEQDWMRRHDAAITLDGHRIGVAANLADTGQAREVMEVGAEGVGLLRTEFVFMARHSEPDLDEQLAFYRQAFDALDGRPLVARTLDVGGDKPLPYWPVPKEDNPFLGVRGIRLCMQKPELLKTQLRALLMAAGDRPLRIMFPMVADWSEWRWAKALFDKIQSEVQATDVQVGIMVEVPSVALNAAVFAEEVDFFSIGTNDLTQYTLAMDRGNGGLARLSDGLNPAVLRLIKMVVDAAHAKGKWVGVCGELASDPVALPLLLGLGVDELSVSLKRVTLVKAQVREWSLSSCRKLAEQALQAVDAPAVRQLYNN